MRSEQQLLSADLLIGVTYAGNDPHEDYVMLEMPTIVANDHMRLDTADPSEVIAEMLQRDTFPEERVIRNADGWADTVSVYIPRKTGGPSIQERMARVRAHLQAEQNKR